TGATDDVGFNGISGFGRADVKNVARPSGRDEPIRRRGRFRGSGGSRTTTGTSGGRSGRMSSAGVGVGRELHIVGFQVGRETYGVPITSLHEIVRVPEITVVPDAPVYLEGVINLRGKIVSVMDLRKRFGEKQVALNKQNRILVVEHSGKLAGLIVD